MTSGPLSHSQSKVNGWLTRRWLCIVVVGCWPIAVARTGIAQSPVESLRLPIAVSVATFSQPPRLHELADRSLLLAEPGGGRVLLLDTALRVIRVVVDSSGASGPLAGSSLIAFGDSVLFSNGIDPYFWVIDPAGRQIRVRALPRTRDASLLRGGRPGVVDGRLVYTGQAGVDSAPLLAIALAPFDASGKPRVLDTIAFVHREAMVRASVPRAPGTPPSGLVINPLPRSDGWTVTSDGRVVVLRAVDFGIDVFAGGTLRRVAVIPHPTTPMSAVERQFVVDSTREAALAAAQSLVSLGLGIKPITAVVSPEALPATRPPFVAESVVADKNGSVWVAQTARGLDRSLGPLMLSIDGTGSVTRRVRLPVGRQIIAFGAGVMYLAVRGADGGFRVERVYYQ
jgi:hypothetical protein